MTETSEYKARVRAKGLEHTGVTEDVARHMYGTIERTTLAVVEVEHVRQVNDAEKGRTVELRILTFEPAMDSDLENTLRELLRSLSRQRKNLGGGSDTPLPLPGEPAERTVDDVVTSIRAHQAGHPHTYEPTDDAGDEGCKICGEAFEDDLHRPTENPEPTLPDADSETPTEGDDEPGIDPDELYAAAHLASDEATGTTLCGLPEHADLATAYVDDPADLTCRFCIGLLKADDDSADTDELDPATA